MAQVHIVFLLFTISVLVQAHPQCMNSRPPHTSSTPHTLCEVHSNYTCCTKSYDIHLQRIYESLYDTLMQFPAL